MSPKHVARLAVALLVVSAGSAVAQQVSWEQEWGKRLKSAESPGALDAGLMGERISLYDGSTAFSATDVEVPGNSAIPVRISRRIALSDPLTLGEDELFGGWTLEVPHLRGVFTSANEFVGCDQQQAGPYAGVELYVPGAGSEMMLQRLASPKAPQPAIAGLSAWTTKDRWYFQCIGSVASGQVAQAFLAIAPDGLRYRFDWMTSHYYPGIAEVGAFNNQYVVPLFHNRLYPTEVSDRFGNWVRYQWSGRKLIAITSNDGRRIDLSYVQGTDRVSAVVANGKTWQYTYLSKGLSGVTLPDATQWTYVNTVPVNVELTDLQEMYDCNASTCKSRPALDRSLTCAYAPLLKDVTHDFVVTSPSGATGRFTFRPLRHGRTYVPSDCSDGASPESRHNAYQPYHDTQSLVAKQLSGPGLTAMKWTYAYGNTGAGYAPLDGSYTPHFKTATITKPDGSVEVDTFGKDFGVNDGQLVRVETMKDGLTLKSESFTYVSNTQAPSMPFDDAVGIATIDDTRGDVWGGTAVRPQIATYTTQGSDVFRRDVLAFDSLARPVSVKAYSGQP